MADLINIPKQTFFKTTLASPITAVQTADIVLSSVPGYTPSGETVYLSLLDPDNPEVISCTGWNSTTKVLTGVTRGVSLIDGVAGAGLPHGAGITVVMSDPFNVYKDIQTAIATKADGTPVLDGSRSVYASDAARDVAVPSPVEGYEVVSNGIKQVYIGGVWQDLDVGTPTPNASTTVAGKVEIATQSELNAGTDTGGTGAQLVGIPSNLAITAQQNKYTYAGTTAGSSTVYTATITPAPSAYAAGQGFTVLMDETNGASPTINFNGLGAKSIVDQGGNVIGTGVLPAGALVNLLYNGTSFQVMNISNIVQRTYNTAGSPHTWTKPTGLKYVRVQAWGGGGGGCGGSTAGGGGGGGAYNEQIVYADSLGATVTVTIGAAGTAGISGGGAGGAGGSTTFGSFLTVYGGAGGDITSGGGGGGVLSAGSGTTGGSPAGGVPAGPASSGFGGGTGANAAIDNGGSSYYGGGGGGTDSVGNGGNSGYGGGGGGARSGTGGTSVYGGAGGAGGTGAPGVAGTVPGGGGGVGSAGNAGGAGGAGRCIVTEYY